MRLKLDLNLIAMALAVVALIEGVTIATNAHPTTMVGFGGLKGTTVMMAGLQLALIGVAMLVAMWWNEHMKLNNMVDTVMEYVQPLAGGVVMAEGLIVAYLAAPLQIQEVGSVRTFYVSAFGAGLFLLGVAIVTLWLFRSRLSKGLALALASLLAMSATGLLAASAAESITWVGLGGFKQSTVFLAGAMLAVFGLLGIALYYLEGWSVLGNSLRGMQLWALGIMAIGLIVTLGAALIIGFAGSVIFPDRLSFKGSTVGLAGMGLLILGMLSFAAPPLLDDGPRSMPVLPAMACLFALLLLPFALLA